MVDCGIFDGQANVCDESRNFAFLEKFVEKEGTGNSASCTERVESKNRTTGTVELFQLTLIH
jgi:hypothetical protein